MLEDRVRGSSSNNSSQTSSQQHSQSSRQSSSSSRTSQINSRSRMSGTFLDPINTTSSLKGSIGSTHGLDHLHPEVRSVHSAGLLGSTGSFSTGDAISLGPRLVQDLADHLNSSHSSDEKKKLVASLLESVDDECLTFIANRVETEKKLRRKSGKTKVDSSKDNSLKNKKGEKCKDPDVNSNGNNSIGSSSMEAIPESNQTSQQQTSPTTGSRKTFAGFLRSKKDKKVNKTSKKDKEVVNGNSKSGSSTTAEGSGPKATLAQASLMPDASSLEGNRDSNGMNSDVKMDEEGYIIPPHLIAAQNSSEGRTSSKRKEHDRFYSDSDSSDDDEDIKKPIHVIIKPINGSQGLKQTGSIAELKETVKGLSISPSLLPSKSRSDSNKIKRRQMTIIASDSSMAGSSEEGRLQRSFSQHLYRPENHESSTSSWFSHGSSKGLTQNKSTSSWGTSFNTSDNCADTTGNSSQASEDRYAALSSLFAEVNNTNSLSNPLPSKSFLNNNGVRHDEAFSSETSTGNSIPNHLLNQQQFQTGNNSLAKSVSSSSVIMGPPNSTALSRPLHHSKRSALANTSNGPLSTFNATSSAVSNGVVSSSSNAWTPAYQAVMSNANNMTRCKSYGSLSSNSEMRMTPVSVTSMGSSRGPSPLTIGFNDTVPLAVAVQESISAKFKGTDESRCEVQMLGSLKVAFPAGIVQVLMNNPSPSFLAFKIKNGRRIEKLYPNKGILVMPNEPYQPEQAEYMFEVETNGLVTHLKKSFEQTPNARYFYLDILKYQLKSCPGAKSCPIQVVTHWKCDPHSTGLKVEYKYNASALSTLEPLRNVTFGVFVDAEVTEVQGKPQPTWNPQTKQAFWNFSSISQSSEDSGLGSLRAKFDVKNGPCTPSPVTVNFSCTDATLSGIDFELVSTGYRVSLVKKQVIASRFSSEADSVISFAGV